MSMTKRWLEEMKEKTFASISWCIDDIHVAAENNCLEISDEQALELLEEIEENINDAMVEAGWNVIEDKLREL